MKKRKASFCRDCANSRSYPSANGAPVLYCVLGHKMRFFAPRDPRDEEWGYKRVCDDYNGLER